MTHSANAPANDFTPPYRWPFLIGLYMAVNAIPDAYAVIDGPDCVFRKAEWLQGKHDWNSSLLSVLGTHRIATSWINPHNVIKSRGESVAARVQQICALPDASVVLTSSMPITTIIGTQYDTLLRDLQTKDTPLLVDVPARGLDGDWLTGYADTLHALATHLDLRGGRPDKKRVGIIGYVMERIERDHAANVNELERLVFALGLEPVSVWLSDRPLHHLEAVRDAGTLLALPTGRRAARAIASQTGATVIDLETPFGAAATMRWLRTVGRATGVLQSTESLIAAEMGRLVPRLEWVVQHVFSGRRVAFSGSPELWTGIAEIAEDFGMQLCHLSAAASSTFVGRPVVPTGCQTLLEPATNTLASALYASGGLDLLIAPSWVAWNIGYTLSPGTAFVEFGFPSMFDHALFDCPFLGFEGWIAMADRMVRALNTQPRRADNRAGSPK